MRRIIAVDSGKYATKAVTESTSVQFLTRVDAEDVLSNDFLQGENTHFVTYNGKRYRVGDGAVGESFLETKMEDIHRICTYTAIALTGVQSGDSIVLGVGCPLSIYRNKKARQDYQRFMANGGEEVQIVVDRKKYTFTIEKCHVFPESAGVVYLGFEKYKDKTVGVIDIGGLNTNCCVYQNIAPVAPTIFTTRLGGKVMDKALLDSLNSSLNLSSPLSGYQMPEIMKNGFVYDRRDAGKQAKSKKIIHDYRLKHIQEIYNSCIAHNWAVDNMDIVFVGGTSLLLKEEIKEVFGVDDTYFFPDAQMLNVKGFLRAIL